MKNTTQEISFSPPTIRAQSQRRSLYATSFIRTGILNTVAALAATACVDDPGTFKPGREVTVSMTADSGSTETASAAADTSSSSAIDASVSETTSETASGGTADSSSAPDTTSDIQHDVDSASDPIDTAITPDIKADTGTKTDSGSDTLPSAPETSPDASPVKLTKSAPANEWLAPCNQGMVIPVNTVFILKDKKTGKIVTDMPFTAYEGFGYKNGVTQLQPTKVAGVAEGVNVYPSKMKDFPQDPNVAGKGNIHIIAFNLPEGVNVNHPQGVESGSWKDALTGKKAQDGVTPLYTHAAILPIVCPDGVYTNDDAQLMTQAVASISKIEFNHNLQELIDTLENNLQGKINSLFAAAGKSYAPICKIGPVTPGDPKIIDVQSCPKGCMLLQISALPMAPCTEVIQSNK